MPDGLAVGVTSDDPALLGEVPEILDGLRQAWLIGFDGVMFDSHDFIEVDWYPSELRIGDRVGVLVAPSGQLSVYVNGKKRVDGPKNVDTSKPLFPAVDLIGNTDGVTLLLEARCPVRPEKQDSKMDFRASAVKARGFHRASLGRSLRLSKDAWTVERLGAEELQGTAIGAAPLELLESGRYFEVHIDEVVPDQPDGMAIGVTSHRPEELLEPVGSSDALRPAWLVGFDGAVWDGAKMEWLLSSWDTRQLSAGDTVGALVDLGNVLRIFVNGQQVAKGPTLPPEKTAPQALLFPVVDLLGAVRRLSLKPMAQAPQELPEPEVLAPPEPVQQQVMSGFYREKVGAQLQLEASDGSARRAAGGLEGGVLLGDAPLEPRQDGAVGYSLVITSAAAAGDKEGIALGVTTRPPKELSALPATADEVDPSFLLGFDGAAWDGSALKWHFSEWQPHTLQASDRVDVLMERGRLQVAVNGYRVAAQQMQVSNSKVPFYALLDISSAGLGVSLQLPVKTPSLA
ncbi:unnamed protein product [Effrenium voratum]|uniref:Uncharacterized protein n=1 Tax=Effrenium voratum TaxID=2562239 RepID=A0AA36JM41_9DINO|nr:unnamed protein product [Effrenium voratum]